MNVAVAFSIGNIIPACTGMEDAVDLQRFEIDSEDGTIYTRSTIRAMKTSFAKDLVENKVEVLVYNQMVPELESIVKEAGIQLVPGKTGNTIKAAVEVACG